VGAKKRKAGCRFLDRKRFDIAILKSLARTGGCVPDFLSAGDGDRAAALITGSRYRRHRAVLLAYFLRRLRPLPPSLGHLSEPLLLLLVAGFWVGQRLSVRRLAGPARFRRQPVARDWWRRRMSLRSIYQCWRPARPVGNRRHDVLLGTIAAFCGDILAGAIVASGDCSGGGGGLDVGRAQGGPAAFAADPVAVGAYPTAPPPRA